MSKYPCTVARRSISNDYVLGIIKGSEESVLSEKGFVDLETYMNVTRRQQGTFTRNRELVYTLFQEYAKMKQDRDEWDAADR